MASYGIVPLYGNLNLLTMSVAQIKNQICAYVPARKIFDANSLVFVVGNILNRATCVVDNVLLGQKNLLKLEKEVPRASSDPVWGTLERHSSKVTTKRSIRYALQDFSPAVGIKFINEEWHFAMDAPRNAVKEIELKVLRILGMHAFPFTRPRQRCSRIYSTMYPPSPPSPVQYNLIYGGTDSKWIKQLSKEVKAVAKDQIIKNANIDIQPHPIEKGNIFLTALTFLKIIKTQDSEIQKISDRFKNKRSWAVLKNGSSTICEEGEKIMDFFMAFKQWKDHVPEKGFQNCFKDFHDGRL